MRVFLTSVAWGGRGIGIGGRGARRGIGGICERIHVHIRVRVLVGFIFLFAGTFMNFHRSQKAFIPAGHRAAGEGDGVRGALPAHHFCRFQGLVAALAQQVSRVGEAHQNHLVVEFPLREEERG